MIRVWIAVALLAGSWLVGMDFFEPANPVAWVAAVALGVGLLSGTVDRLPDRRQMGIALVLLLPAAWLMPWPWKGAPLLMAIGLATHLAPGPRRWPGLLGQGALAAGALLLAQGLGILAYASQTARSHDLPWPLVWLVCGVVRLMGVDAAVNGSTVAMRSGGEIHRLAATWELLLDPATFCFFLGGLAVLGLVAYNRLPCGERWSKWIRAARTLLVLTAAWLPIRVALLVAVYLHRAHARNLEPVPIAMDQFLSTWVHVLMLAGPVLLAIRFVRLPVGETDGKEDDACVAASPSEAVKEWDWLPAHILKGRAKTLCQGCLSRFFHSLSGPWRPCIAILLIAAAAAIFTTVARYDPVGRSKGGRVMVVERHSTWEPTTKPYSMDWYGELASYNYAAIYDYCSQYFNMSRLLEEESINLRTLARCDVLVIKTPTARYSSEEVDAVVRFVEQGGSLLLIGDHTNVFDTSTYLNDVARHFGFTFRDDLLFRIGSPYVQPYAPGVTPHPVVQHVPPMHFAVSCSIDPGRSAGRAVVRSTGLWNLPPDHHADNYHPEAEYRPEMRYGAFIQVWATRYEKGRVLAFTDSTIFSNFCTYQPGKAELMRGMLDWLNHRSVLDRRWVWLSVTVPLVLVGLVLLTAACWLACTRRGCEKMGLAPAPRLEKAEKNGLSRVPVPIPSQPRSGAWIPLCAAAMFGWTAASLAVDTIHRLALPVPEVDRQLTHVVIDRTVSAVPLSLGAFVQGENGEGYGLFEQWIARLGCYTSRETGRDAFAGDGLVIVCPTRSVTREYCRKLEQYVRSGHHVLIVDSPDSEGSTANSLLRPFGLSVSHAASREGNLMLNDQGPAIPVMGCCEVTGGRPLAHVGDLPVAAVADCGKGKVIAVGFGFLFNDANMGMTWMTEPDAETQTRYNLLFELLRHLMD